MAATPYRWSCRCSSVTFVEDGPSATKSTATSVWNEGSNCHAEVICHERRSALGGSHVSTFPTSHSVPSSHTEYQRPPTPDSMNVRFNGDFPMWCCRGHHLSTP